LTRRLRRAHRRDAGTAAVIGLLLSRPRHPLRGACLCGHGRRCRPGCRCRRERGVVDSRPAPSPLVAGALLMPLVCLPRRPRSPAPRRRSGGRGRRHSRWIIRTRLLASDSGDGAMARWRAAAAGRPPRHRAHRRHAGRPVADEDATPPLLSPETRLPASETRTTKRRRRSWRARGCCRRTDCLRPRSCAR
jgi:hypothetical protein